MVYKEVVEKQFQYDSQGQLIKATNASGETIATNEYDDMGRLTSKVDGNGNTTKYYLDDWGRIAEIIMPEGGLIVMLYCGDGKNMI